MDQFNSIESHREPWNKGKLVDQKAPLKDKQIGAIRVRRNSLNGCATWLV